MFDARQLVRGVAQLPVRGVFEDQNALAGAEPAGQIDQGGPALPAQGQPGRVLEVIDRVNDLHAVKFPPLPQSREERLECLEVHPVLVHGHREDADAVGLQQAVVHEVRRRLRDHDVARVEQDLPEQVEQLLGAGGDADVGGGEVQIHGRDAVEAADVVQNLFAQGRQPLRGAVLQGGPGDDRVGQDVGRGRCDFRGRQRLLIHQTRGKGDEGRVFQSFQHVKRDG